MDRYSLTFKQGREINRRLLGYNKTQQRLVFKPSCYYEWYHASSWKIPLLPRLWVPVILEGFLHHSATDGALTCDHTHIVKWYIITIAHRLINNALTCMYNVDMQYKFLRIQDMLIFCLKMKRKGRWTEFDSWTHLQSNKENISPLNFNKKHLTIVALVSQKKITK